jgi:hypothetical protein
MEMQMRVFSPHLAILPGPQRRLWDELPEIPEGFVLHGGTAIALRLGHRQSVDFDFFTAENFDPDVLLSELTLLNDARIVQKNVGTLTVVVERGGPVQVSFFSVPRLGRVCEPEIASGSAMHVASLTDLAGLKAFVVQKRAEWRDYADIDALLSAGAVDLPTALAAARVIYGPQFNPQITLKALSYFGDGTLPRLAEETRNRLAAAARSVDLDRLPALPALRVYDEHGRKL